jgi:hypothetical protein
MGVISDLETVGINVPIVEKKFKEGTDDEFSSYIITVEGKDYRVPGSVLLSLQTLLENVPGMKYFKVIKKGTTRETTKYTVVPLGGRDE